MSRPITLFVIIWWSVVGAVCLLNRSESLRDGARSVWRWSRLRRSAWIWDNRRVTKLQVLVLLLYIAANAIFMFATPDYKIIQKRAAAAAATNLVPLMMGGRTCLVADAFGMPLQIYYFMHHWLGRLGFIESLVHAAIQIHLEADMSGKLQEATGLLV